MNKINKLIGFTTITVDEQEIPIKLGSYAIDEILKAFKIELGEINTIFRTIEIGEGEDKRELPVPIEPNRFAATLLWAGADYVSRFNDGNGYNLLQAYDWIDQLGGVNAEPIMRVYTQFFKAVSNGGAPPVESPLGVVEKKSIQEAEAV